jgi:hypothetical protein
MRSTAGSTRPVNDTSYLDKMLARENRRVNRRLKKYPESPQVYVCIRCHNRGQTLKNADDGNKACAGPCREHPRPCSVCAQAAAQSVVRAQVQDAPIKKRDAP